MNFNEEMDRELRELGLGGQVVPMKEDDKGTEEDYLNLARKGRKIDEKNTAMFRESAINAEFGMPCGNTSVQPRSVADLSKEELMELVACLNQSMEAYDQNIERAMKRSEQAEFDMLKRPTPSEEVRKHMLRKIQQVNPRQH